MLKATILILVNLLIINSLKAQAKLDSIVTKLEIYGRTFGHSTLFVQTDKTLYTNNETIWFTAYVVQSSSQLVQSHTLLNVSLINQNNKQIILNRNFAMQNSIGFGSIKLPDSIQTGNYRLATFTNVVDSDEIPRIQFVQDLTIKYVTQSEPKFKIRLLDTVLTKDSLRVGVQVLGNRIDKKNRPTQNIL